MWDIAYETMEDYRARIRELEKENRKLEEERDFFKEQAILWRNDYKNEYEENRKLKLHIEAKDKAYTALLKDYEELKENRKKILDEIDAEIERFKDFRKSLEK